MKSEKAKEAIERYRNHGAGRIPPEEIAEYCRLFGEIAQIAEQEAEERMHEQMTRWRDPQKELPEDDVEVLCKTTGQESPFVVLKHNAPGWWVRIIGGWAGPSCNVIGWREI